MAKNMCQSAIAKELGISRSGISEIILKFQDSGSSSNQPRSLSKAIAQDGMETDENSKNSAKEYYKDSDEWVLLVQFGVSRYHCS